MDVKELLPKTIFDNSHIDDLKKISDEDIEVIIYDLLEWLQDYNWPVTQEIVPILINRENLVFPYISEILNGKDYMWKYWVMELLIPEFSDIHKQMLRKDLLKIINNKEKDEDSEDLREIAIECYNKCFED